MIFFFFVISRRTSPADSQGSSTFLSSNRSNQMPPQPPVQTSTVISPAIILLSSFSHAGHFIFRTPFSPLCQTLRCLQGGCPWRLRESIVACSRVMGGSRSRRGHSGG